jgi:hypothetical protein
VRVARCGGDRNPLLHVAFDGMALIRLYILLGLMGGTVGEYTSPYYAKGVMERVARNRDMPIVPCMIASPTIPIGSWVWVYGRNTGVVRECRVTDTSAQKDRARHIKLRRIELSWEAAVSLCGRAAMKDRPEHCPILVIKINE